MFLKNNILAVRTRRCTVLNEILPFFGLLTMGKKVYLYNNKFYRKILKLEIYYQRLFRARLTDYD